MERENTLKKHYKQPPAVVLGLGQNGMATVRALGRVGVPVIGIDTDLTQPGAQTRYCTKIQCDDFVSAGPGLLETLIELGQSLDEKGVIFPSGDLNLDLVSEQREKLEPYFHLALAPKEEARRFLNKKSFLQFAIENDFPIPQTYLTEGREDIRDIAREIAYPCLIKPFLHSNSEWKNHFDTRLFLADSEDMLLALYERIAPVHQDLLIQEYMPGGDSQVYWGVSYLNAQGDPLAVWTGRKLRMYPRGFGTATLAESLREPWVAENAVAILQKMGLRGYGVVEFKKDRRDGRFKITEPTGGRTWFPHSLVTRSGINLPYIWYRDMLGETVESQTEFQAGIKWIHEERDLKTVMLYFLPEKHVTWWSWLTSYRGKRTYAYSAWDDPGPILNSVSRIMKAGSRRITRRLFAKDPERVRTQKSKPKKVDDVLLAADPTVGYGLRRVSVD